VGWTMASLSTTFSKRKHTVLNFDTFEENSNSGNSGFDDEMIEVMASTLYSMYQAGLVEHSIL
jgi:hypothetical protein